MEPGKTIQGRLDASALRIAIVASKFNPAIVEKLISSSLETLSECGLSPTKVTLFRVPGAYEIPLVCESLASSSKYDAIITLGAVIRGETIHFDLICETVSSALSELSLTHALPITFGIVAAETEEQALVRCRAPEMNRGAEATLAAVEMANLMRQISGGAV